MSRKRKFSDNTNNNNNNNDEQNSKQRQRMTNYHQNSIYQTTQQKLYDGSKNFFRKLKDSINNNEIKSFPVNSCCSSMHCTIPMVAMCDYCERQYCSNHLTQCSQCNKTYCLFCSTNINNELSICLTCVQNE
ncbi:unnamed protein product [Rotaria sordida]|uniref:Apoptosis regulatory protein Siva n=1 Tax=Rotaria sordida TaxID=392033 RepID=A0A813RGW9_9BILA|nr:unnamed protein product [Rotaria sordida]CAF0782293.1 unnamed protein product [Rotaria sordida]CAF0783650.1 unnamed protein product [Rotaria sordida]CAF0822197.1 unnamed protein product [Rotaria sordida]